MRRVPTVPATQRCVQNMYTYIQVHSQSLCGLLYLFRRWRRVHFADQALFLIVLDDWHCLCLICVVPGGGEGRGGGREM